MSETSIIPATATDLKVQVLALNDKATAEQVLTVYDAILSALGRLKEIKEGCEGAMMDWIAANGDLILDDTRRYVLSYDKTTKCNDVPAAVEEIMKATEGDFKRFCDVLSSGAIKHGAARKVLDPQVYERIFTTTVKTSLDNKPIKVLTKLDEKFMPTKAAAKAVSTGGATVPTGAPPIEVTGTTGRSVDAGAVVAQAATTPLAAGGDSMFGDDTKPPATRRR